MFYYFRKYPFSLAVVLAVTVERCVKPPSTELSTIPNIDKIVHFCMYFGLSGMLWLEFLRAHRGRTMPLLHAFGGAWLCPVLFSGGIELLQAYCTTYRGGDWLDFAANSLGATLASLVGYALFRQRQRRA